MKYSTKRNLLDSASIVIAITAFITCTLWLALLSFVIFIVTSHFYPINWAKVKTETGRDDEIVIQPKIRTVEGVLL